MSLPQGAKEGYGSANPEQVPLERRMGVEAEAFNIAMASTLTYEQFIDQPAPVSAPAPGYAEVPFADRVATVNIGPMVSVNQQGTQGQYDLAA